MISHDRAQELISARMDVPLAAAEHRELQRHLAACDACRDFVSQADDLARGLQVLPRLAPSPAVSRAVMEAVRADTPGWSWLRRSLQALSSPGMAVASGLALVVVLAGTLVIALNAPGSDSNLVAEPESSIAAVAIAPIPTEAPTRIPTTAPEPTATRAPLRMVTPAPTKEAAKAPAARPTATRVAIGAAAEPTVEPVIEPAIIEEPSIEPVAEDPAVAMAVEDSTDTSAEAELAQVAEPPVSDERASEAEPALATDDGNTGQRHRKGSADEPAMEPVATEAIPDEAIAALENASATTDIYLPPAPPLPMPPSQAFLPITPTPVSDGTPTPEPETQVDAPQLAEGWSDDPGVTALVPESPQITDAIADVPVTDADETESGKKHDRSSKDGKSQENQQSAYGDDAMGWSMAPVELAQSAALLQTADETDGATTETAAAEPTAATEPPPQYDPA